MVCSQLAMLTTTVDTLISILYHRHHHELPHSIAGCMDNFDAKPPQFVPTASELQRPAGTSQSATGLEEQAYSSVHERYISTCEAVVSSINDRGLGQEQLSETWEAIPATLPFMTSDPVLIADRVRETSKAGAWIRVTWPAALELSADDVMDHFSAYGEISNMDWLENERTNGASMETMKLYFESSIGISEVLQKHQHAVPREADGKLIPVRVCVKFSDNAVKDKTGKNPFM
jgi:hypothetical protein